MLKRAVTFVLFMGLSGTVALAQDQATAKTDLPAPSSHTEKSPSQVRAAELDRLFGQLHATEIETEAKSIEEKIWSNWARTDSVTAELLLSQASRAMAADQYDEAQAMLDKLVATYPTFAEGWNRRATLFFKMRRYNQSLADIEKVLELEPRHFGALSGRAMIYMELERPDDALAAYREALTMNPHMEAVSDAVKRLEKERPNI